MNQLIFRNLNDAEASRGDFQIKPSLLSGHDLVKIGHADLSRQPVFFQYLLIDFFPVNGGTRGSLYAQTDLLSPDFHHINLDLIADRNAFTDFSG